MTPEDRKAFEDKLVAELTEALRPKRHTYDVVTVEQVKTAIRERLGEYTKGIDSDSLLGIGTPTLGSDGAITIPMRVPAVLLDVTPASPEERLAGDEFIAACQQILAAPNKPNVPQVKPLVRSYYAIDGNGVGGSLHIVLDDHNTDDSSVEWCIEYAAKNGDPCGEALGRVLLRMSKTQREKLASDRGKYDCWW